MITRATFWDELIYISDSGGYSKRSKASTTQHLAITFSQGWMAILLNLS